MIFVSLYKTGNILVYQAFRYVKETNTRPDNKFALVHFGRVYSVDILYMVYMVDILAHGLT